MTVFLSSSNGMQAILSVFLSQIRTSPINIDDSIALEMRLLLPYLIKSSNLILNIYCCCLNSFNMDILRSCTIQFYGALLAVSMKVLQIHLHILRAVWWMVYIKTVSKMAFHLKWVEFSECDNNPFVCVQPSYGWVSEQCRKSCKMAKISLFLNLFPLLVLSLWH